MTNDKNSSYIDSTAALAGDKAGEIARANSSHSSDPRYLIDTAKATAIGTVAALSALGIGQ